MPTDFTYLNARLKELTQQLHAARLRMVEAKRLEDRAAVAALRETIGALSEEIRRLERRRAEVGG